jgi:hypothetical protein
MSVLAGVLLSAAAAALLFRSWRQGSSWLALAGWLLAFAALWPWSQALGPEIGSCYAVMVFVCLVWCWVLYNREPARSSAPSQRPWRALPWPPLRDCGRQLLLFLLSVPAAGMVALMLTVALVLPLSWAMPLKVAVVIAGFPLLWACFSVWICAQQQLLRPLLATVLLFSVSALLLLV